MNSIAKKLLEGCAITVSGIALIGGTSLLISFLVKWTWNAVIPYLFGLPTLTWGKAWCLAFLCINLFKSNSIHNK